MPIFEVGLHFIERLRRETASQAGLWCETIAETISQHRFALVTAAFSFITALLLSVLMLIGGNSLAALHAGFDGLSNGLHSTQIPLFAWELAFGFS